MLKVQFGYGGNKLDGWSNHDSDIDIRQPLPFSDGSVDYIFHEHLIEHVTHQDAYRFFKECHRILKLNGVMRIVFPNAAQIHCRSDEGYWNFLNFHKLGTPLYNIVFNHGHQSAWSTDLVMAFLGDIGFKAESAMLYISNYSELNNVDGHHKAIGEHANNIESSAVEGIKCTL